MFYINSCCMHHAVTVPVTDGMNEYRKLDEGPVWE